MNEEEQREYRNLLRQSWVTSSFEKDKSILTVSSAGIGLLITLASAFPIKDKITLFVFMAATLAFMIAVCAAIWIFSENRKVVLEQLHPEKSVRCIAKTLDRLLIYSFLTGLILSTFLAILVAVDSYVDFNIQEEIKKMSEKESSKHSVIQSDQANSLDGISQINPQNQKELVIKSLDGIGSLAPQKSSPKESQPPPSQKTDSTSPSATKID